MSTVKEYTVSFAEITRYTVTSYGVDGDDAIKRVRNAAATLPRTPVYFNQVSHSIDEFEAEPVSRPFRVCVSTRATYLIELDATDRDDAEEQAEEIWNETPSDFEIDDFSHTTFTAEEVNS